MKEVAAIILAAGSSSRLGEPKQLARVGSERLLERAVRVAFEAGCAPVIVVLGSEADRIVLGCALGPAQVVTNEGWGEGMGSSIRVGIEALGSDVAGTIVMVCDQPAVTVLHLRQLRAATQATASSYAGRRGVPAYFPVCDFRRLLLLRGDVGARELLASAPVIELAGGELDVDTVESLEAAREAYAGGLTRNIV